MRRRGGMNPFAAGLIALVVIGLVTFAGFTKRNPFASHYEIRAAFEDAVQLRPKSPVRIAGVNVGHVTRIERLPGSKTGALVTLRIEDNGRPVRADARAKIRPRIFLEGNYFVDLQPGSPSAPEMKAGATIPVNHTSAPVGLGQLLEALQGDTREDLQVFLREYGKGVKGGAEGYNRSIRWWAPAFRDSAVVNDATRGLREHDLSEYIESAGAVAAALDRDPEALKGLITDFAATAGAFASEQENLSRAVRVLPDTLRTGHRALGSLNAALPPLRRFAREMVPAVRAAGPSLDATLPFVREARGLFSARELGDTSRRLRAVVPDLVELNRGGVHLQEESRLLSSCQVNVVIPTAESKIEDRNFPSAGKVYEEGVKWLPGIAGESRSFDANGQYIKTTVKGGANLAYALGNDRFLLTSKPLLGVNPPRKRTQPPYRPDVPCETQEPPDLRSIPGPAPEPIRVRRSGSAYEQRWARAERRMLKWLRTQLRYEGLQRVLSVAESPLKASQLDRLTKGRTP